MALPDLMDLVMHDPRQLVSLRAVAGEDGGPMPDVEALWRKPLFRLEGGGQEGGKTRYSLEDLIDRFRGLTVVDGGAGAQPLDVPFTSLIVMTAEPLPGAQAFARFLTDRIEQRFRDAIDPERGIEVHVETSTHGRAPCVVYFGYGIHAPSARDPRCHGDVIIRLPGDDTPTHAMIGSRLHGGLYRGQERFVFSRSETLTPAVNPDLPGGTIFFLGHFPGEAGLRTGSGGLPDLLALARTREAQSVQIDTAALPPGRPEVDRRFEIATVTPQSGRQTVATVDVVLDRRQCRLQLRKPGRKPCLAVVGIAVPDAFEGRKVARYWVERTAGGRLQASAMLSRRDAIVVQGKDVRLYDRVDLRYDRRAGRELTVETVTLERKRRVMVMADEVLGYLDMPQQPVSVGFGPDPARPGHWALDWVGQAVCVQFGSGALVRLDALYDQSPVGMMAAHSSGLALQSAGDMWLLQEGKAEAAGSVVAAPGTRLLIGPLVVEVMGAES